MTWIRLGKVAACGLLAGCQGPISGPASGFGESLPEVTSGLESTSGGGPSTGSSSTSGPGGSEDDSAGSTTTGPAGPLHDVGYSQDLGPQGPPGCKGKIDFLFMVSSHGVMQTNQERMIAGFQDFHATIASKFEDFDYHIMVVDGGPGWGASQCNESCTLEDCPVPNYPCEVVDTLTACDERFGAGAVFNAGKDTMNAPCGVAGGKRYMTRDQPDAAATFACMARVGTSGADALGMAMTEALSPMLTDPQGCNEGFLRDDALLMVTFVMGGHDYLSKGTPESWAQAVIDAKHGDLDSIVMFGFFAPGCTEDKWDDLCQMVMTFPTWQVHDNLADDYGLAFEAATGMVTEACSKFIPQ